MDNTARLEVVVVSLRSLDFDGNVLVKFRSTKELTRQFVALRKAAVDGQREVDRLREAAKAATGEQAGELKQFGDALAGALFRQRKLADNLGSFIAFLDASEPDPNAFLEMLPFFKERLRLTSQARDAADQFAERIAPVVEDEDRAAAHVTVFTACRGE
ncbi:MAG: hypothetical protein GIW95_04560 [Candidatus Eremiobacteraeota bacterium]|nr:hypothetical protein [Candidatus Eremiobacteraeota bacterium]